MVSLGSRAKEPCEASVVWTSPGRSEGPARLPQPGTAWPRGHPLESCRLCGLAPSSVRLELRVLRVRAWWAQSPQTPPSPLGTTGDSPRPGSELAVPAHTHCRAKGVAGRLGRDPSPEGQAGHGFPPQPPQERPGGSGDVVPAGEGRPLLAKSGSRLGGGSLGRPPAPGFTAESTLASSGLVSGKPLSLKVVDGVSRSAVAPAGGIRHLTPSVCFGPALGL